MLSLCAPKECQKSTMAAKKTYHPDPYRFKRQFSYKHMEKVFERRKTEQKKNIFHRPRIEPSSVTTKQIQFSFVQRLSTWANEAAARNHCVIVTSSFSQTKGFFCFSFNNRSPKDAAWKTESVLHTLFLDNEKRPSETNFRAMFLR